eukprot:COSAG02_NODE_6434_length_3570_cov_5.390666_2_plen_66_part_01
MVLRGGGARARSWGKSLSGARERAVAQPRVCSSLRSLVSAPCVGACACSLSSWQLERCASGSGLGS